MGRRPDGFTLMEIILVILILGFMAGMVMPFAGHMDEQTRIKKTRQTLETIRAALVGPRGRFDDKGRPVLEGYVGDVGQLPRLYNMYWDTDSGDDGGWVYNGTDVYEDVNGTFASVAPAGLWLKTLNPVADADKADIPGAENWDKDNWEGPYMFKPYDERDNQIFEYDEYSSSDTDLFESFETDGRLADAWGRNLAVYYTVKDDNGYPEDMYFVSRGPDGKWEDDPHVTTNSSRPDNEDNIVLSVNSQEWDSIIEDMKNRTRERLKEIRKALVGDAPAGTNYGYTGHTCRWPDLYNWDITNDEWTNSSGGNEYTIGQPRQLWDYDEIKKKMDEKSWDNPGMTPFFSRYLEPPVYDGDEPEEDKLKDAWGEEIYMFRDSSNSTVLILSKGPDRNFSLVDSTATPSAVNDQDVSEPSESSKIAKFCLDATKYDDTQSSNKDNIVEWVRESDWKNGTVKINFTVYNADNSTANSTKATFYNIFGGNCTCNATVEEGCNETITTWSKTWNDFEYNATTGPRYILFWHTAYPSDDTYNGTENGTLVSVDVRKQPQGEIKIYVDRDNFKVLGSKPLR